MESTMKNITAFEDTHCMTWFKDNRAAVILWDMKTEKALFELWDADAKQAIQCGFIDRSDFHRSAYAYYRFLNN